jgi:hypothetical protein
MQHSNQQLCGSAFGVPLEKNILFDKLDEDVLWLEEMPIGW